MTTYRLFPSTNGPSSPVSYSGNFLAGIMFKVTAAGTWFTGYYHWVPTGGDTVARKFALWNVTSNGGGTLLPAATVTSGTLTAGQWNFVPLATPVALAPSTTYCACTGWSATAGFPDSDTSGAGTGAADSFGTGGHTAGITQGLLFAFSDQGFSAPEPHGMAQGVFSTAGTDPTVTLPAGSSNSGNFWMDVQVSDTVPAGYSGSYRIYPNKFDTNTVTSADSSVNYSVATEFHLSQACTLNKIWYYSPSGTTQLATSARIWTIAGPNSGTSVVTNTSPTWSGAAASGWVSCSFSGVTLQPGSYKVSVYNGAATPDGWGAKDANTNYWATGDGASGLTSGPVSMPGLSTASLAYKFVSSGGGNTPPYTDGSTTEAGQSTFVNGNGDFYPYLYVDGLAQNYWLDVEVTPLTAPTEPITPVPWQFLPHAAPGEPFAPWPPWAQAQQAAVTVPGTASLSGSGTLSAAAAVTAGASLTGTGSLSAAAAVTAGAALSGSGSLSAAAQVTAPGSLSGTGSLLSAAAIAAAAVLSGSGTVTAAAALTPSAGLSGSGSLSAAAVVGIPGTASLSGSGSLAAAAAVTVPAALSGSGALSAGAAVTAPAALSGSGALAAPATVTAPAALNGSGTITASSAGNAAGTASLSGSGSIVAGVGITAPAGLSGSGSLSAAGAASVQGAASLSGAGSISAAAGGVVSAAALLSGSGSLLAAGFVPGTGLPVAWSVQPAALRWEASPLPPRWLAVPSAFRWRIAMANFPPIAAVSLECVNILWQSDLDGTTVDPTGQTSGQPQLPVQFAFPQTSGNYAEPAEPSTWYAGSWLLGGTGRGYVAQALVGPGGVVTLTAGLTYDCWTKVTGSPESPAKFAGTLAVY